MQKQLLTQQEAKAFRDKALTDPEWFCEKILKTPLWEKEKEILNAIKDNAEVAVRSCHASGKTYTSARVAHWWLLSHEEAVVITTAPTFRQVREILWREIRACAATSPLYPQSAILETQINLSEKHFALGLSSDKSEQFQGFHSPHLLVIVDEASGVAEEIFQAIDGLAPEKILLIGNPTQNSGRFADSFRSQRVKKIHISAFDVPNVKEQRQVIPGLISQNDINRIGEQYGTDSDVYRVRVLGEFPRSDSNSLIGLEEVEAAIRREVTVIPHWEKKIGVDVARYGDDRGVILVRHFDKVTRKELITKRDLMHMCGEVIRIAKEEGLGMPQAHNIFVDVIGIGAGVVDRLKEQGWNVSAVNVAEKADDYEHYANLRAELYNEGVKKWLKTGSLPDDSFYELANIRYKFTSKGQLLLEAKEDMKKRGLSSPDVADGLALTFAKPGQYFTQEQSQPLPAFDFS